MTRHALVAATLLVSACGSSSLPQSVGPTAGNDGTASFALKEVRYVRVPSFDGTELEGWIGFPDVPAGTRIPVALASSPYNGYCSIRPESVAGTSLCVASPNHPGWWSDSGLTQSVGTGSAYPLESWGVPPIELVRRGIAAAFFSVRGTGNSDGCFEFGGSSEQKDQAWLVDWLAAQDWSSGRVAMGGLSYQAATAWQAAAQNPPGLRTIVTSGIVSDYYTWYHTPQGAAWSFGSIVENATYTTSVSLLPTFGDALTGDVAHGARHTFLLPERTCPEVLAVIGAPPAGVVSDNRDPDYWDQRRYIDRFHQVTAAVLLAQGFDDTIGHTTQENLVWASVSAPKRQIEGHWGHAFPNAESITLDPNWEHANWHDLLLAWLDYWLKDEGPVPDGLDHVDYQDSSGAWRRSATWPPQEGRDEVMYLADLTLGTNAGAGARSFLSEPLLFNEFAAADTVGGLTGTALPFNTWPALCLPEAGVMPWLTYWSEPLPAPVVLAGNPFAYLQLTSNLPGGIVSVHVLKVAADFSCAALGVANQVAVIAFGAADLRFHSGSFAGSDFPIGSPTHVRIDLWDNAMALAAGDRVAVVVSYGEASITHSRVEQPYFPLITVLGDGNPESSHIVLRVVEGTLGGQPPTLDYPQRPFAPAR